MLDGVLTAIPLIAICYCLPKSISLASGKRVPWSAVGRVVAIAIGMLVLIRPGILLAAGIVAGIISIKLGGVESATDRTSVTIVTLLGCLLCLLFARVRTVVDKNIIGKISQPASITPGLK